MEQFQAHPFPFGRRTGPRLSEDQGLEIRRVGAGGPKVELNPKPSNAHFMPIWLP